MKSGLLYRILAVVGIVVNAVCFAFNLLSALFGFIYSVGFYHWFAMQVLFPTAVVLLVWMLVSGSSRLKSAFFGYVAVYVLSTAIALFFEGVGLVDLLYLIVSLLLGGACCVLPIMHFHDLCALLASRSTPKDAHGTAAGREQAAPAGRGGGAKFSVPKPGKKSKEQKSKRRTGLDFEPAEAADAAAAAQPTADASGASSRTSPQQAASSQPAAAQAAPSQGAYQQAARQQTASAAGWSGASQQAAPQQAAAAQGNATQSVATQSAVTQTASAQAGVSSQEPADKVAVNTCPRDAFLALPGFSIAQASRAVSEREQNGPYRSVDDFVARNNVKPHFAVQMEGLISVETATKASAAASKRPRGRGLDL